MIKELLKTCCHYPLSIGKHFIYDDHLNNKPIISSEENGEWSLKVVNNLNEEIHFFQNDGCLMNQNDLKKIDWLCFCDTKFYFIEAKDVKQRNRRAGRKDAVKKFNDTIPYFLELYPCIKNKKIFVIMNFRSLGTRDNKNKNKVTNAARKEKIACFEEKFNAKYLETNYLEFN